MERGFAWLLLLATFVWLAYAGWKEYRKVEAYRLWASQFERAKYDIYAVLGQSGDRLSWGKPTIKGPIDLETFSLNDVRSLRLLVDDKPVDLDAPPTKGRTVVLEFLFPSTTSVRIPFTEISLASAWGKHFQKELQRLRS